MRSCTGHGAKGEARKQCLHAAFLKDANVLVISALPRGQTGNASEPLALLLTGGAAGNGGGNGGGWLGQLPLQPAPADALRAVLEAEVAAATATSSQSLPAASELVAWELRHWGRMAHLQVWVGVPLDVRESNRMND